MVAPTWKRARDVGAALLVVILLAAPIAPFASAQVPQPPPVPCDPKNDPTGCVPQQSHTVVGAPILTLAQGSLVVHQTITSVFVDNNSSASILVDYTITNTGGVAQNIPVFAFPDLPSDTDNSIKANDYVCEVRTVPAAVASTTGAITPGVFSDSIQLLMPYVLNASGGVEHSIPFRVEVNVDPVFYQGIHPNPSCGSSSFNTWDPTHSTTAGNGEASQTDNVAFTRVIKDARLDWGVDGANWCRGAATDINAPSCDLDFYANINPSDKKVPYNTVRTSHAGDADAANATYFAVNLSFNASQLLTADGPVPWVNPDVADYGAASCQLSYPTVGGGAPTTDKSSPSIDRHNADGIQIVPALCPPFDPNLDVRIAPAGVGPESATQVLTNATFNGNPNLGQVTRRGIYHSLTLQLEDNFTTAALAGDYVAYVRVNPQNATPEADLTNDYYALPFHVFAPDFASSLTLPSYGTTPTNAIPYPNNNTVTLPPISATLTNLGDSKPLNFTQQGNVLNEHDMDINVQFVIDNETQRYGYTDNQTWKATDIGTFGNATATKIFAASFSKLKSIKGNDGFIEPGPHSMCVNVDYDQQINETNESNNVDCFEFYLKDDSRPVVEAMFGSKAPRVTYDLYTDPTVPPCGDAPSKPCIHPKENVTAFINISSNAQSHLNVTFKAVLSTNASVVRYFYPCPAGSDDQAPDCANLTAFSTDTYLLNLRSFVFYNASDKTEDWILTATGTDTFGSNATSDATTLHLRHWAIQSVPSSSVIAGFGVDGTQNVQNNGDYTQYYPDGTTFRFRDSNDTTLYFHLDGAWTGYNGQGDHEQPNITTNLQYLVYLPGDPTHPVLSSKDIASDIRCNPIQSPIPGKLQPPTVKCTSIGNFSASKLDTLKYPQNQAGTPGKWNLTVRVTDWGGEVRDFNYTFTYVADPPTLDDPQLSATDLAAGNPLNVHVNVTDDFDVNGTYVNFTRLSDGTNISIPLVDRTSTGNGTYAYNYSQNLTTGHGHTLGLAGAYHVVFASVDPFGNWNETDIKDFKLNDSSAPSLLSATVNPPAQEASLNVTFAAVATDESNETVTLQVLRGQEEVLRVNMTEDPAHLGNFTYVTNFTIEGTYTYNVWATDSVNLVSGTLSGSLSIKDNLGPRFDVRQPSVVISGQRYASATPTFDILVYDSDNVSLNSIGFSIDGVPLTTSDYQYTPVGPDPKGFVLTYKLPATANLKHRDTLTVNLTAIDLSEKSLPGWSNFTVIIDDVPPVTELVPFHPSYRADPRNYWNVSLATQFQLRASDDDGLPTDVSLIKYRLCLHYCSGDATGTEGSYSGPFTIASVPDVYKGPAVYELDYWSYDQVGNTNRTPERILVYVDALAPSLDPFGSVPQGRFVNATFLDDSSGVGRAVVWWRLNDQPYTPQPLDFTGGVWSTILPEGKKGDRMQYYLQAWDRVENTATFGNATSPYASFPVDNHNPFIKITSPADGSKIARQVEITWNASDQDNDPLTFQILYKSPTKSTYVELAKLESPDARSYLLDTTRFQDGQYTFQVRVSDGLSVEISETTVTIQNAVSPVRDVPQIPDTTPGQPVLITAEITKANAVVEAHVFRDGKFVGAYPMNDEGRDGDKVANDGIYSVRVTFDASGDYSVQIFTRYQEDGQLKESTVDGPHFGVKLTPAGVFSEYGTVIVAVGLLAVAGVGVAAVVLLRRR